MYVLVPADKATNDAVAVWHLYFIQTLKQELSGTRANKETYVEENSIVNNR